MAIWKQRHELKHVPPPNWLVVDVETTTNAAGNFRAVDGEKIYLLGVLGSVNYPEHDKQQAAVLNTDDTSSITRIAVEEFKVLCGHNLKFDLEHLRRDPDKLIYFNSVPVVNRLDKICVFDTQFVTYLHSGHTMKFATLEESCAYWGVPMTKSLDLATELPKVDYNIRDVPNLVEYLFNDLEMTAALVNKMLADPWVIENFRWILAMHDGYLASHEIEYNGMHVDPTRLADLTRDVQDKHDALEKELKAEVGHPLFEPASNDHVATYLFGGDITYETRVPAGVYSSGKKLGQPRYSIVRETVHYDPKATPSPEWLSSKTGKYSVNEDVLLAIGTPYTKKLLEFRELSKLRGTYLEGLGKHLRIIDGSYYVLPQINLCATATGRTSSSKPNMQNNPTHDSVGVASIYTSRWGAHGHLLEVDFKQVEVLALAIVSGDKQLIEDIVLGRDIHEMTGQPVFGKKMTKEQRRVIKTINFGLIYGGGADTLAQQAKVAKSTVLKAISSFYRRYPKVKEYFNTFKEEVQGLLDRHGKLTGHRFPNGVAQKEVIYTSLTGRRYAFKDYYNEKMKEVAVSHTETRNYPIQGLATGDLVLTALGKVWRKLLPKYEGRVKLIGLVHDSMRFDIQLDDMDSFVRDLKCTLEKSGIHLNAACGKPVWDLPVKVTFSKGTDFFNMEEFEVA